MVGAGLVKIINNGLLHFTNARDKNTGKDVSYTETKRIWNDTQLGAGGGFWFKKDLKSGKYLRRDVEGSLDIRLFQVKGDVVRTTGSINTGSNLLEVPEGRFDVSDIGKVVSVYGAGGTINRAYGMVEPAALSGTITAVNSPTQAVLSSNAISTAINQPVEYMTDDSAALRQATSLAGKETLYIPDIDIYAKNVDLPDNICISGVGSINTLPTAVTNDYVLKSDGKKNVRISGIRLDGNKKNTVGNGSNGITLLQVFNTTNFQSAGVQYKNSHYLAVSTSGCSRSGFYNNYFDDVDCFIITRGGSNNLVISGNLGQGGSSDGYAIWGEQNNYDKNITLTANLCLNKVNGSTIIVRYGQNVTISGCIGNNCANGIALEGAPPASKNVTITSCNFDSCRSGIAGSSNGLNLSSNTISNSRIAINIVDSRNVSIIGNTLENFNSAGGTANEDGIRLTNVSYSKIRGNVGFDTREVPLNYAGIRILGNSIGNMVSDNSFTETQFPYFIADASVTNTTLARNYGSINDTGTGTIIENGYNLGSIDLVASSSTLNLGTRGDYIRVAASAPISVSSIVKMWNKRIITLHFTSANISLISGGNIILKRDFTSKVNSVIMFVSNGTNWIEISRNESSDLLGDFDVNLGVIRNTNTGNPAQHIARTFRDGGGNRSVFSGIAARGTQSAPLPILNGDRLVQMSSLGYYDNGSGVGVPGQESASVSIQADENFTSTAEGTRIVLETTNKGTKTRTVKASVTSQGNLLVGTNNDNGVDRVQINGNLLVSGFLRLAQYTTATRPAYSSGTQFYDATLNKMVIGGISGWEVVTSSPG